MKAKKEEVLTITLSSGGNIFKLSYSRTIFPGYELLYKYEQEKDDEFPNYNVGDSFIIVSKNAEQKFTTPPARYNEAKIVKIMEEVGIGRPSTYASTIQTLNKRKYIIEEKGEIFITEQGEKTAHILDKYFHVIVNAEYTADMEKDLDKVQDGEVSSLEILTEFYGPFIKMVDDGYERMYADEIVVTGDNCPICGSPLVYKVGKNGQFIACSNYPKCKYVQKEQKQLNYVGRTCPECGHELVEREKNGKKFIACSNYPKCNYVEKEDISKTAKLIKKCPACETGYLIRKRGKYGYFLGCNNFPKCNHIEQIKKRKGRN